MGSVGAHVENRGTRRERIRNTQRTHGEQGGREIFARERGVGSLRRRQNGAEWRGEAAGARRECSLLLRRKSGNLRCGFARPPRFLPGFGSLHQITSSTASHSIFADCLRTPTQLHAARALLPKKLRFSLLGGSACNCFCFCGRRTGIFFGYKLRFVNTLVSTGIFRLNFG